MDNFVDGFQEFQDAMLEAIEDMGGDHLANMAAEHIFSQVISGVMRTGEGRRHQRDFMKYSRPHKGDWLRADATDWADAIRIARQVYQLPEQDDLLGSIEYEKFSVAWTSTRILRLSDRGKINLCYSTKPESRCANLTAPGRGLIYQNGLSWRSDYRDFKSAENRLKAYARWARKDFAC